MGSLLVVTGPPGSGKSTVSKVLAERAGPSALIEGDQFFAFLARDAIEPWLPESHAQNTVVLSAVGGLRRPIYAPWLNPPHPLVTDTVRPEQIAGRRHAHRWPGRGRPMRRRTRRRPGSELPARR